VSATAHDIENVLPLIYGSVRKRWYRWAQRSASFDIEDLQQAAGLSVCKAAERFELKEGGASWRNWAHDAAMRGAIDFMRTQRPGHRNPIAASVLSIDTPVLAAEGDSGTVTIADTLPAKDDTAQEVCDSDLHRQVVDFINAMEGNVGITMRLSFLHDWRGIDIGELIGLTDSRVSQLRREGRRLLAVKFASSFPGRGPQALRAH
jgi:RNA polymerase sigma factor (sigma-70 family)